MVIPAPVWAGASAEEELQQWLPIYIVETNDKYQLLYFFVRALVGRGPAWPAWSAVQEAAKR